jgi:hypothetical protein
MSRAKVQKRAHISMPLTRADLDALAAKLGVSVPLDDTIVSLLLFSILRTELDRIVAVHPKQPAHRAPPPTKESDGPDNGS